MADNNWVQCDETKIHKEGWGQPFSAGRRWCMASQWQCKTVVIWRHTTTEWTYQRRGLEQSSGRHSDNPVDTPVQLVYSNNTERSTV